MFSFCRGFDNPRAYNIDNLLSLNDTQLLQFMNHNYKTLNLTDTKTIRHYLYIDLINRFPGFESVECKILNYIWLYFPPILLVLGSIANCLAISVLCHKSLLRTSTYNYLLTITIIDELILLTGLLRRWIDYILGYRLEHSFNWSCKLFQYIGATISYISVWLIVIMTIERLIILLYPLKVNTLVNTYRAKLSIIITIIILSLIPLHLFETISIYQNSTVTVNRCYFKTQYDYLFRHIWFYIDAAIYSFIPFVLIIIFNAIIIFKSQKAQGKRQNLLSSTDNYANSNLKFQKNYQTILRRNTNETKQLTLMLLLISIIFLVSTTPLVTMKIITLKNYSNDNKHQAKIALIDSIFEMLMYTNHSINFLLYCTTGKRFRNKLHALFRRFISGREVVQSVVGNSLNLTLNLPGNNINNNLRHDL